MTIRFCQKKFVDEYDPTIEDSYSKQLQWSETEKPVMLEILDTAGQDEYSAMRESYMLEGEGFVLVFAVNSRDSFDALVEFFELIERVRDCAVSKVPIVLVANKVDVDIEDWQVSKNEAELFASRMGCKLELASAMTGQGVDEVFKTLVKTVMQQRSSKTSQGASGKEKKQRVKISKACVVL
jgi:GTPase KRas protein